MKRLYETFVKIPTIFSPLLFPPICLHCCSYLYDRHALLCDTCLITLDLIDPTERCPFCFSADYSKGQQLCSDCSSKPATVQGSASAFDYYGVAAGMIKQLKYGNQPYLARGCGAYMVAQFLQLKWPMPDLIVPVPISLSRLWQRGYNQSHLLAETVSTLLDRPLHPFLKRKSGDYSQAGLSQPQRLNLEGSTIYLQSTEKLENQVVLLIDDVLTTGSTVCRCAEALLEASPKAVYVLTFCRSISSNSS